MSTTSDSTKDVDFEIVREDWTRYKLVTDNVLLRVRISVAKLIETGTGETGVPDFAVASQNCLSIIAPKESLKRTGEAPILEGPILPEMIKEGTEIDYEIEGTPKWQEYKTTDGWTVMIKPEIGRVVRIKSYSRIAQTNMLEPIYWVNLQPVFRVRRT